MVYRYRFWDEDRQQLVQSSAMATLECIRNGLGQPLIESGLRVPSDAVDLSGRLVKPLETPETADQGPELSGDTRDR